MISTQEIKEYVKEITNEPNEEYIKKIQEVFELNPWLLEKLTDEQLKTEYIKLLYNYKDLHGKTFEHSKENEILLNYKKMVSEIVKEYYVPTLEEVRSWRGRGNQEIDKWLEPVWLVRSLTHESMEIFKGEVANWYEQLIKDIENGEKNEVVKNIIEHWKGRADEIDKLKGEVEEKELTIKNLRAKIQQLENPQLQATQEIPSK